MRLLLVLLLSFEIAFAADVQVYRFGDTLVAFKMVNGFLVNNSCNECEAIKTGREYGKEPLDPAWLEGGKNPIAVRCTIVMKGAVMIGVDRQGNENAFCYFHKDESFLR